MFENVSKQKIKKIIVFKYTFQLILIHFILGTILSALFFAVIALLCACGVRDESEIQSFFTDFYGIGSGYLLSLFCGLANILSVIPFFKLIADCLRGGEEERIIALQNVLPNYELQTIRESKRFMCDTFSRKKNLELLLYDENKNKYRFYWNESYGESDEKKLFEAKTLRISYFPRSKIIFNCEIID